MLAEREELQIWLPPKSRALSETLPNSATQREHVIAPQHRKKPARCHQRRGLQHPRAPPLLPDPRRSIPAARARPSED